MSWRIIPLELGHLSVFAKVLAWDETLSNEGDTTRIQVPLIGWLLINDQTGEKILVDSGGGEDEEFGTRYHNPLTCKTENHLDVALKRFNTTVDEIKTVILTHLHCLQPAFSWVVQYRLQVFILRKLLPLQFGEN